MGREILQRIVGRALGIAPGELGSASREIGSSDGYADQAGAYPVLGEELCQESRAVLLAHLHQVVARGSGNRSAETVHGLILLALVDVHDIRGHAAGLPELEAFGLEQTGLVGSRGPAQDIARHLHGRFRLGTASAVVVLAAFGRIASREHWQHGCQYRDVLFIHVHG